MLKEIKAAGSTTQVHIETWSSKAKKDFESIKDTTQKFIHCLDQRLSQCGDEWSEVKSTYEETSKICVKEEIKEDDVDKLRQELSQLSIQLERMKKDNKKTIAQQQTELEQFYNQM